jgi:hypothetical protein
MIVVGDLDPRFKETVAFCEADSFSDHMLWKEFSSEYADIAKLPYNRCTVHWEQDSMGRVYTIGYLNDRPICVSCHWVKIDGLYVCFYYGCSQLVDRAMIEKWLEDNFGFNRENTNAMNFHNIVLYIHRLNEKSQSDRKRA